MKNDNELLQGYENASVAERKKACESLGVPYICVGDEKEEQNVIIIDLTQETAEVLEAAQRMEWFKQCSITEIAHRLLLKGLEMEGYLKDTKGA